MMEIITHTLGRLAGSSGITSKRRTGLWLTGGALLMVGSASIAWARIAHGMTLVDLAPVAVGMGGLYLALTVVGPRRVSRRSTAAMVLLALAMRLPWFFVPAQPGDDYRRYLWDGAVTANGLNPYAHSPEDVARGDVGDPQWRRLSQRGQATLTAINHPHLRTIYPPAAQGAFALAYRISPFSLTAWRVVLLGADAVAALAVVGLLRSAGRSETLAFIYLWNPLVVIEGIGAAHVDLLAAALVAIFAWALVTKRPVAAAASLGLAVGVKLWPVLLAPFLVGAFRDRRRGMAVSLGVLAVLLTATLWLFSPAFGRSGDSGLVTYARIWTSASGAYSLFHRLGWGLHNVLASGVDGHVLGRALALAVLLPIAGWLGVRRWGDTAALCRRMGLAALFMLLLGPSLWPWYYMPVIPLAALARPRASLLLWTALVPLCYLEGAGLSPAAVTLCVHVPVWGVLAAEWWMARGETKTNEKAAHA